MSVDVYVAPRLGRLGRLLYDRCGWPPVGEGANLATSSAWANFLHNVKLYAPRAVAATLFALSENEYLPGRRARQLQREWPEVEAALAAQPLSAFVRVVHSDQPFEGSVVSREGTICVVTISAREAEALAASTRQLAEELGDPPVSPATLRDAFFYQCREFARILRTAAEQRRGVVLG
jgi:hypothetical protein